MTTLDGLMRRGFGGAMARISVRAGERKRADRNRRFTFVGDGIDLSYGSKRVATNDARSADGRTNADETPFRALCAWLRSFAREIFRACT